MDVHTLDVHETLIGSAGSAHATSKSDIEERAQRLATGFLEIFHQDPLRLLAEARPTYASDAAIDPLPAGPGGPHPKIEFAAFDRVTGRISLGVLGPARRHLVVGETAINRSVSASLAELRPLVLASEGGA